MELRRPPLLLIRPHVEDEAWKSGAPLSAYEDRIAQNYALFRTKLHQYHLDGITAEKNTYKTMRRFNLAKYMSDSFNNGGQQFGILAGEALFRLFS